MPAGKFGEKLRRERESRGITLEQIAEATKISSRNLRALEQENFSLLPGGIFNKGFVRSYARHVGINEERAVADYMIAAGEKLTPAKLEGGGIPAPPPPRKIVKKKSARPSLTFWVAALLLLIVALALGGRNYYYQYREQRAQRVAATSHTETIQSVTATQSAPAPQDAETQQSTTPPAQQVAASIEDQTKAQPSPEQSVPATAGSLLVQVHVNQDAWVQLTADGSLIVERLLPAGTDRAFYGSREIKLVTGNAGGIDISVNGKRIDPLGPEGARREKTFTVDN